jgi:hypothetical protein
MKDRCIGLDQLWKMSKDANKNAMTLRLYLLSFFFLLNLDNSRLWAQKNKVKLADIQYITIQDTFLLRQIKLLIAEETTKDSLFRLKKGFITLTSYDPYKFDNEAITYYHIKANFFSLDNGNNYPPYYSMIDSRLIFIYQYDIEKLLSYTNKSKKKLKKKLEPFLSKPMRMYRDINGKKVLWIKKFRDETFQLHGGKRIFYYQNKPPVVKS